ncbi:hypothetical protein J6590_003256 [Homalodisca vitripennis]|nr:hypothetical protein J6590_003256 [Homalodisca vitripennis]
MTGKKINEFFSQTPGRQLKRQRLHSSPGAVEEAVGLQGAYMATGRVGDLSQEQLMEGLSQLLDTKLSKLATKDDLLALSNKVNALEEENKALHKELIMLKSKRFVVHRDFPREIREKRANLVAVRAEVERVSGRRRMPLAFDHLTIESVRFTWEEGRLMAGRDDGSQRLNELLGHDFSDFLRKLQEEQLRARTRAPGVKGRTESQRRQHQPTSEGDISANNAGCGR